MPEIAENPESLQTPVKTDGGFWHSLSKPIFCLAPMEEVTDVVFREMFAKFSGEKGASDQLRVTSPQTGSSAPVTRNYNNFVMFTEFINVDGLLHPMGYEKLKIDLEYTNNQRPIVVQLWGTDPEKFYRAAQLVAKLGFDGIDINMGCPQDKEIGLGACAALIKTPKLASEIIEATKKGAGDLPLSVKTRVGYSKTDEMEQWVTHLLSHNIAALTLHARTKQEKSKVPAHWQKIKEAVEIRDKIQNFESRIPKTLIIGNGDIKSYEDGLDKIAQTGCDGVMIGRGAFGCPWIFRGDDYQPTIKDRLSVMLEHARLFVEKLGGRKSFMIMRKNFKAYANGFEGAGELRSKLMEVKNLDEVEVIVAEFLQGQ